MDTFTNSYVKFSNNQHKVTRGGAFVIETVWWTFNIFCSSFGQMIRDEFFLSFSLLKIWHCIRDEKSIWSSRFIQWLLSVKYTSIISGAAANLSLKPLLNVSLCVSKLKGIVTACPLKTTLFLYIKLLALNYVHKHTLSINKKKYLFRNRHLSGASF